MKKVILSVSLICGLFAASAQQQPAPQKAIILQVTPEGYKLIIQALAELPAKVSYDFITALNQQYAQQLQGVNVPSDTTARNNPPIKDKPKEQKKNK
jgi:hypothetical protein